MEASGDFMKNLIFSLWFYTHGKMEGTYVNDDIMIHLWV